jgi:hypothetical protein
MCHVALAHPSSRIDNRYHGHRVALRLLAPISLQDDGGESHAHPAPSPALVVALRRAVGLVLPLIDQGNAARRGRPLPDRRRDVIVI